MAGYRAYFMGCDGQRVGFEPLICVDDAEAIVKAKQLADALDVEVWIGERLVSRLPHKPE
jgi:hypothetical protein